MSRAYLTFTPRRHVARTLADWKRAGLVPNADGEDYGWTADHVIDDPREPIINPTGILDARGKMLCRVTLPIKVKMGFHIPGIDHDVEDTVSAIVPEDMLSVSDIGVGIGHIDPAEIEDDEDEDNEAEIRAIIEQAMKEAAGDQEKLTTLLAAHGLGVTFQDGPEPDEADDHA